MLLKLLLAGIPQGVNSGVPSGDIGNTVACELTRPVLHSRWGGAALLWHGMAWQPSDDQLAAQGLLQLGSERSRSSWSPPAMSKARSSWPATSRQAPCRQLKPHPQRRDHVAPERLHRRQVAPAAVLGIQPSKIPPIQLKLTAVQPLRVGRRYSLSLSCVVQLWPTLRDWAAEEPTHDDLCLVVIWCGCRRARWWCGGGWFR